MRVEKLYSQNAFQLFLFFLLFILSTEELQAQDTLTINTNGPPPYNYPDQTGILDRWLKEAFGRIGIGLRIKILPAERSLVDANNGIGDGEAVRISGLSKQYPNLIEVPEKVYVGDFAAFSKNLSFKPSSWDSLKPYRVAYIRGHKICEANIVGTKSLHKADNVEELFKLLRADRVDVVVVESLFGKAMLKKMNYREAKMLSPPLATLDFYLYLNKKHTLIVPKIARALRSIKQDGTYQKIYLEGIKRLDL